MHCPTLSELPPPPLGKTGWPWNEETQQLPDKMPDGGEWPRISIVTPNYNYGQFIEETIRSVLLQGYPNLEYIVIDGGSTDDSVEIIKKYEPWLSYWVSEKDNGQANAINKGFGRATGLIFNWINSDDILCRNSLQLIARGIQNGDAFGGAVLNFNANHQINKVVKNHNLSPYNLILGNNSSFQQPGLWLRRILVEEIGGLKEDYNCCFDWDLTIKYLSLFSNITYTDDILAKFRLHNVSKTVIQVNGFDIERGTILKKIIQEKKYAKLRSVAFLRLRQRSWNQYVTLQLNKPNKNRIYALVNILFLSCFDPKVRWNRFTLGAAKRIILT